MNPQTPETPYQTALEGTRLTMAMNLTPQTLTGEDGQPVSVLALPVKVAWSRKAARLSELGGGEAVPAYVGHIARISPAEFDRFAVSFMADSPPWLVAANKALPRLQSHTAAVLVVAPERPVLLVDCSGYSYARYVAKVA
jgi:hypothetical protein